MVDHLRSGRPSDIVCRLEEFRKSESFIRKAVLMTKNEPIPRVFEKSSNDPLVSVIIPCYNSETHVVEAIASVTAQSVDDLEILVVDDCSTDNSAAVVAELAAQDARIRLFLQPSNLGVGLARNRALMEVKGRYIAYLDADDYWLSNKLECQIAFMNEVGAGVCFTSYETIEEDGSLRNIVHVPSFVDYSRFLRNTITCSHTLLFDTEIVDKALLNMPDLRRGQDFATWLQVAKEGHIFYGLDKPLAKYRKSPGSLSSNKLKAIKRTWNIYRNVEHLSIPFAAWCQVWQLFYAVKKRIGRIG